MREHVDINTVLQRYATHTHRRQTDPRHAIGLTGNYKKETMETFVL